MMFRKRLHTATLVSLIPLVALALALTQYPVLLSDVRQWNGVGVGGHIPLNETNDVDQIFVTRRSRIDAIGLVIATCMDSAEGPIRITVSSSSDFGAESVDSRTAEVDARNLTDWSNHVFRFPPLKTFPGSQFILNVQSESIAALATSADDVYGEGGMTVNGQEQTRDLVFRTYYLPIMQELLEVRPNGTPSLTVLLSLMLCVVCISLAIFFLNYPGVDTRAEGRPSR